jgi:hypothetical protein
MNLLLFYMHSGLFIIRVQSQVNYDVLPPFKLRGPWQQCLCGLRLDARSLLCQPLVEAEVRVSCQPRSILGLGMSCDFGGPANRIC